MKEETAHEPATTYKFPSYMDVQTQVRVVNTTAKEAAAAEVVEESTYADRKKCHRDKRGNGQREIRNYRPKNPEWTRTTGD